MSSQDETRKRNFNVWVQTPQHQNHKTTATALQSQKIRSKIYPSTNKITNPVNQQPQVQSPKLSQVTGRIGVRNTFLFFFLFFFGFSDSNSNASTKKSEQLDHNININIINNQSTISATAAWRPPTKLGRTYHSLSDRLNGQPPSPP